MEHPVETPAGTEPLTKPVDTQPLLRELRERVANLEARVEQLEAGSGSRRPASASGPRGASPGAGPALPPWTAPYEVAELQVGETWIEMHEPSARPQLQRLIREVVEKEGPITQTLALRRVREAWGLRRAGARVQEVFDQAVRQLVAAGHAEREGDALVEPGQELNVVRVPAADDATRRTVDEISRMELELALERTVADAGRIGADELTAAVSRLFGWTRRGAGIQAALDKRVTALSEAGRLAADGSQLRLAPAATE